MITLIAAMSKNKIMGKDGGLPWCLPEELAHFKATTLNKTVVMGRRTFDSIGRPLPKRRNLVLTRDSDWQAEGVENVSLEEVLALSDNDEDVMVIGGREIYELFLPHAQVVLLSVLHEDYEGDVFFPDLSEEWVELTRLPKRGFDVIFYVKKRIEE